MKKILLFLLLTITFNFFGQTISPLLNGCFGNTFDLTSKNQELLNGLSANNAVITFHLTQVDANFGTNPVVSPDNFVGTNNQVIFVKILDTTTNGSTFNNFSLIAATSPLFLSVEVLSPISCLNDGTINAIASGGAGNNFYTLLTEQNQILVGPTTSSFFYVGSGFYRVRISDSAGCDVFSNIISLVNPPQLLATTQVSGNTATILAIGGEAPYMYSLNGSAFTTTSVFTMLQPGTYTATVKDANGCIATSFVTILTATGLVANDDIRNFSNPPVITPPLILNDTFNGNLITDTSNYNLTLLSVSPFTDSITLNQFGSIQINENTANGQYIVNYQLCTNGLPNICDNATVTINVNNCNFDVLVGSTLDMPISTYIFSVISPVLLLGPFQYSLDNGQPIVIPSFISNPTFSIPVADLAPGIHTVRVTDLSNMCTVTVFFDVLPNNKLTGSAIATYIDNNNDGLTNVGDTVTYQFTVNNITNNFAYNISLGQGTPPNPNFTLLGENIPSLAIGESNSTNFTGVHVITQNDINQGFVSQFIGINAASFLPVSVNNYFSINTPLNISDGIKLNAFLDYNGNGIQDNTEQNFPLGKFKKKLNGGLVYDVTTNGVYYLYENNPSNIHYFSYVINSDVASQYNPSTTIFNNISVANGSGITTLNFPIIPLSHSDLAVHLFGEQPRPGFTYFNTIVYKNEGNTTISSGTLTFNKDNALSIINVSQAGTTATASGFSYDFTNLLPFESRTIYVNMQIPVIPIVNLGEILTNSASISVPANDVNVTNNSSTLYQTIVGSFDPNDKAESHGGQIVKSGFGANDYLTYRIRFENTGTASAITVKVTDVLDSKLDETSIKMVDASHNYVLNRTGRNLEWKFDGINLPPSIENTQIGHGYVLFQVKPKTRFAVGDIISNIANIYFDFNPAIVTNESLTEFVTVLSNDNFVFNNLKVYPNPVTNILNINNDKIIDKIEISNVLGQTVLTKNINTFQSKIDISNFTNGFYFVKIISAENEKILKIVKE